MSIAGVRRISLHGGDLFPLHAKNIYFPENLSGMMHRIRLFKGLPAPFFLPVQATTGQIFQVQFIRCACLLTANLFHRFAAEQYPAGFLF